ncbi:hypothetical protein HK096_000246, partial [Nowakowskiella sp. JEL0078]
MLYITQQNENSALFEVTMTPHIREFKGQTSGQSLEPVKFTGNSVAEIIGNIFSAVSLHLKREVVIGPESNEFHWSDTENPILEDLGKFLNIYDPI